MLNLLKKNRHHHFYYENFYKKKSNRFPKISLLWLLLACPILIVISEFLAQTYLGITGRDNDMNSKSPLVKAYQLNFLTANKQPIERLTYGGNLVVKRISTLGYELIGPQKS